MSNRDVANVTYQPLACPPCSEHSERTGTPAQSSMKRVYHKSTDFRESEEWNIQQHLSMTPEERQKAAAELRKRVYGEDVPDVREFHRKK